MSQIRFLFVSTTLLFICGNLATGQMVSFDFEELELDGSNIATDGNQVIGHCESGVLSGAPVVPAAGVDWLMNSGSVEVATGNLIFERNLPSGTASGGTIFGSEDFGSGVVPPDHIPFDSHFAPGVDPGPDGLMLSDQSDLHLVMQGIMFGPEYSITISDLEENSDYRVQIISWDAGVEGESLNFGSGIDRKEFRRSAVAAGDSSIEYHQFVVDGDDDGTVVGNSSDEITAALITAEFTTDAGQTSIVFNFSIPERIPVGENENDNCIYNALVVHELGEFLLGDVNCDGSVDLLDVGPFVELLTTGGFSPKADINSDGIVDLLDVTPFVDLLTGN